MCRTIVYLSFDRLLKVSLIQYGTVAFGHMLLGRLSKMIPWRFRRWLCLVVVRPAGVGKVEECIALCAILSAWSSFSFMSPSQRPSSTGSISSRPAAFITARLAPWILFMRSCALCSATVSLRPIRFVPSLIKCCFVCWCRSFHSARCSRHQLTPFLRQFSCKKD